ncbi:glycine/sarcosine/betaine reductase complex component C subunit alpha [Clostridium botulinum]|uniref:Glycine/sarcosine/betaine reductase complex component C alpha subunit n=1 Tax=Clostridium botulinum (strain Hall / ATCC 3502 / NCTC 13319 / Type A) TaxID=441771 RepID=A5I1A2_CLOBH|nr:glycine/sarcosine/betaine reductase complex component C subunit alpha [Clostridium botulinum]ABS35478.1 glycine reductase complex component C, alpha subunit [Clostridium botulinum A str. ATCC 19397]ABS38123.1 glycine reductase complex component C, alpha subunit [Clostridium botulinum A str. Hall]AWB17177.1 glycine reductase [Clostridium botulinum]AWB29972.1 glycine reductase [Clostridium botulinum]EGT5617139.1 glycine reductase [Clostridium botulinum]
MDNKEVNKIIGKTLLDIAESIEKGDFSRKIVVGITTLGSEHGVENLVKGAEVAAKKHNDIKVVLIGPKVDTELEIVEANEEDKMYNKMEELLDTKYIDAAVTMHYNFPIGVSTVGKVVTPADGKEMFLATTTGTASMNRTEAMIKNAVYGIITAKTMGIKEPNVGILNLDGARQVEKALKELDKNGYKINFANSLRADGGSVMRGNDLLKGTPDVMVTDTLTGNLLMKVFSSYTTGGSYEGFGYGYGPGIGEDYERNILILSRASGVPVVANAIEYAKDLVKGNINKLIKEEFKKANEAKLKDILSSIENKEDKKIKDEEEVPMPTKEIATASISGIDVMDIEDAQKTLWKEGIYAEGGMGCTGPVIKVNDKNYDKAAEILTEKGFIA